jgi:hypothetical protein
MTMNNTDLSTIDTAAFTALFLIGLKHERPAASATATHHIWCMGNARRYTCTACRRVVHKESVKVPGPSERGLDAAVQHALECGEVRRLVSVGLERTRGGALLGYPVPAWASALDGVTGIIADEVDAPKSDAIERIARKRGVEVVVLGAEGSKR